MIKFEPLQFYVDKLKNGEKFSFARYGDGELYCMWGARGQNSNKCKYYPELREKLLDSMKHKDNPSFIYGLQRVLPQDEKKIISEYPDVNWHDSEFLSIAVAEGKLFPLIEQLRKMTVTIITNKDAGDAFHKVIGFKHHICVEKFNAFDERERVLSSIRTMPKSDIYIFSCGMAANAFIGELHGEIDATLFDAGHIWDPFYGLMSRCDLEGKLLEDINKNLYAPTN